MVKRIVSGTVLAILMIAVHSVTTAFSASPVDDFSGISVEVDAEKNVSQTEYEFKSEEEIQYYAYLDMTTEDESLHPIILAARKIIIYRRSWVADEVDGWVKDKSGNIIETLPHFSDLFPNDWEIPIESIVVDLSYYGR